LCRRASGISCGSNRHPRPRGRCRLNRLAHPLGREL
jgi:hypothetical protein